MSIKTTHYIDRGTALEIYFERTNHRLPSNEELEEFLEEQEESYFRNYYVLDEVTEEDTRNYYIKNKNEF